MNQIENSIEQENVVTKRERHMKHVNQMQQATERESRKLRKDICSNR